MIVGSSDVASKQIPIMTIVLILVNIAMFARSYSLECLAARDQQRNAMEVIRGNDYSSENTEAATEFFDDFGFQWSDLSDGNYKSLLTHMFVHGGIFHLLGNMLALWAFAVVLEEVFGSCMFTCFYFVCGLAACLIQGLCAMESTIPMIGASGAIAGVLGAYIVILGAKASVKLMIYCYGIHIIQIPAPLFGLLWLGSQCYGLSEVGVSGGGVALAAHVGGFAAGAMIAWCLKSDYADRITADKSGELQRTRHSARPALRRDAPARRPQLHQ